MTTRYVVPGEPGKYRFIRQQDTETRPYTNCRLVAFMMQMVYAGVEFTDDDKFCKRLRDATSVAEVSVSGATQGTTAADLLRAADAMVPWVPVKFSSWSPDDLLDWLSSWQGTVSVAVDYSTLPSRLRVFSPRFRGRHQVMIRGARVRGTPEVLWVDCLGPRGHKGKWVKWSQFKEIMRRSRSTSSSGRLFVTSLEKGSALSTLIRPARDPYFPPASLSYKKGAEVYEIDQRKGTLVRVKDTTQPAKSTVVEVVRVTNYPTRAPSGPFAVLASGGNAGKLMRLSEVTIVEAPAPGDCEAAVDAATKPLIEEIKQWEAFGSLIRQTPQPVDDGSPVG